MRTKNFVWMKAVGACVAAGVTATLLIPNSAEACGGTFCDGGVPGPMPVDQTGENVIFVMGGDKAEVHIQISYDPNTNAEKFAWMIPLTAVPDFTVGSQPLFDQMRNGSVPLYGLQTSFESCDDSNGSASLSEPNGGDSDFEGSTGGDETGGVPEPDILLQTTVGAFDVVVLTDTELAPIQAWLESNGYNWDPNAAPILEQYLAEGNVIAALKLTNGAGINDIHPITLSYDSGETCFPLRLTRIAAVEDMDIRVFVLANDRAAPTNYRHVLVNPLKIDWLNFAINYKEVITNAVDADEAGGRAFVTEYAGTSATVPQFGIFDNLWDEQAFVALDPTQVVNTLNAQGLASCYEDFDCQWNHPLVYGLLLEFLPPPDGVDPINFYPYLANYAADIDLVKWNDGAEFSTELLGRIIEPGLHAVQLLETWPYLTRMYTTISPAEMMEDPIFHLNPDLADVEQTRTANNFVLCNGDAVTTLPDGREVYVPGNFPWPDIPGEVWWEEEVQTIALKGAPMTLVNNTAAITKVLTEWNLTHGWPRVPGESGGSSGDLPTGDYTSGSGGSSDGGEASSDGPPLAGEPGCACNSQGGPSGLLLLGLLGLLRPRRRR
jgi:uncharacterized membrane protein YgcG